MTFNDLSADLVKRLSLRARSPTMQISTSFTRIPDHERSSKVFVETRPEKIQALTGFEPMTSADGSAVLHQLNYQANWELVTLWVCNLPVDDEAKQVNW